MKKYIQELERKDKEGKELFLKSTLRSFGAPFDIQRFKAFPNKGENFIKVVSFTTIPREDMSYLHYVLEGKKTKRLVWDLVKLCPILLKKIR